MRLATALVAVLIAITLAVSSAFADETRATVACYFRPDMESNAIVEKTYGEKAGFVDLFQLIRAGKCVGAIVLGEEYDNALVENGVRAVQAYPYPGYGLADMIELFQGGARPPKQLMFFLDLAP